MALTYPLVASVFADKLRIKSAPFVLQHQQELSGVASGNLQAADLAPAFWQAEVETVPLTEAQAAQIMALINSLAGAVRKVYLYNPSLTGPQADPDGTILGAASVTVGSVASSYSLTLAGLPASYVITCGDYFSISYGTPSRTYLGQFAEGGTANGLGAMGPVDVAPAMPAGIVATNAVMLIKPQAKCKIVPGSAYPSIINPLHQTIKFSARQTHEPG